MASGSSSQWMPPPASHTGNTPATSSSLPTAAPWSQVKNAANSGAFLRSEKKPEPADGLDDLDSTHCTERFKKYDMDYARGLMEKYFSGKTLCGGTIFDEQVTIDDEIIKSSRLPCFQSYADPVVGFQHQCSNGSTPAAERQANMDNGKHLAKKNS